MMNQFIEMPHDTVIENLKPLISISYKERTSENLKMDLITVP